MFDTFRVPGFNTMARRPRPAVTIACFTTFTIEAVLKMPEFWWMHNAPMTRLFEQGLAFIYAKFDHIFLNGDLSRTYLSRLHALRGARWGRIDQRARVVSSRGHGLLPHPKS